MNETISFDKVDKYGPQTLSAAYTVAPDELDRTEVAEAVEIAIEAKVDKGNLTGEYIVEGSFRLTAALACSRCLDPTPFANDSTFHVRFRPRPETLGPDSEEVEITEAEELDVEYYSEREIPLRDFAIEQIQLSIPMKPLCDDKCFGLCSQCGANRNREECSCAVAVGDDRWGALQGLRDELAKKHES
ncbi:MAG: hypothetical protein JWO56_1138 [Acidobacteria bacterium]|nr:hypothetical protein [Acidobacteriota bacterium]